MKQNKTKTRASMANVQAIVGQILTTKLVVTLDYKFT